MNTTCTACHQPVRRSDAIIRSDAFVQVAYHRACFTIERAVNGIDVTAVQTEIVGRTLSERLAEVRAR